MKQKPGHSRNPIKTGLKLFKFGWSFLGSFLARTLEEQFNTRCTEGINGKDGKTKLQYLFMSHVAVLEN